MKKYNKHELLPDSHKDLINEIDYNNLIDYLESKPDIDYAIELINRQYLKDNTIWFTIITKDNMKEVHFEIYYYDPDEDLQVIQMHYICDNPKRLFMDNFEDSVQSLKNFITEEKEN